MRSEPTISITISTGQGWPAILETVRSAEASAAAVGGEVVVTDGSRYGAPALGQLGGRTTWESIPGASVFQLRRVAYQRASAPIVAITEDHCRVGPEWAGRMLAAHAAHPTAAAIGGSVENGAVESDIDWASFLVVQATIAAPIASGATRKLAGAVNASYKRAALPGSDGVDDFGTLDVDHQRRLALSGQTLIADDSIRVIHDQSLGVRGTVLIHFHAGRTYAGFLRRRMDRNTWLRLFGVVLVPYVRFARAVIVGRRKGYGTIIDRCWPQMLLLYLVQMAGQIVGFAAGPGDSPNRVQ